MLEQGKKSINTLKRAYTVLFTMGDYDLLESNIYGEEQIICYDKRNNIYCYTQETLDYTLQNQDEFTWYKVKEA